MTDLYLELDGEGRADLVLELGDLKLDNGLRTPVLVSLFSDRRADADDDLPDEESDDPHGYWAEDEADRWGSKVWLEARGRADRATATRLQGALEDALEWMLREDVASSVEASAELLAGGRIDASVSITRGAGARWEPLWSALEAETFELPGIVLRFLEL